MLSDKKPLYKWITLLALVAVAVVAVMFYNAGAEKMDKWKCPECATINQRATECQNGDCEHKAALLAYSFRCPTCHYLTWDEDAPESYTQNCEMCQENHFALGSALGKLSQKLYARGSVVFEADYQKVSGNAFHVQQNLQAIRSGGLFGNQDAIVYVPASDTDSVMASSMNRLGLAYALIVLFALGFIFLGIYRATSPLRITATCAFVFQALYTFGGTLNFLPMTGIGMPLVSRGGTNLIISFLLIYFMISAVRNREA